MGKKKESANVEKTISLKDHPSLIAMGDLIKLRVFEDFFVDTALPKWKEYERRKKLFLEKIGLRGNSSLYESDVRMFLENIDDEGKRKEILDEFKKIEKDKKIVDDDRYHIREKHEREVKESRQIYGSFVINPEKPSSPVGRFFSKVAKAVGFQKGEEKVETAFKPIEVSMLELKDHLVHTSSDEMKRKLLLLNEVEARLRDAGQIAKAEQIAVHRGMLIDEQVIVDAGFESYIEEEQAIDFLAKSERGATIDFIRYYDEIIPEDVVEKKKAADALMVFDNYCIAHYSDIACVVEKQKQADKEERAKKIREKRRDPILFGMIKGSRKLFHIVSWVTKEDDLTIEKLEEVIGGKRKEIKDSPIASVATLGGDVDVLTAKEREGISRTITDTSSDSARMRRIERSVDMIADEMWNRQNMYSYAVNQDRSTTI